MDKGVILIVDDEDAIRHALERYLSDIGYKVFAAANADEATKIMDGEVVDLALVDLVMPGMDGIGLVREMKVRDPDVVVIIMTAYGTITSAVNAIKAGAYHYITKPFELDDVSSLVAAAVEHKRLKEENRYLKKQLKTKYKFENIVGTSEPMMAVFSLIEKVADTDSTVLILGESGTGKELVARAIHYNSKRGSKPLITVNCGAIPETLLESELFGYVKGAFTDAYTTREGKFDAANGGSIFLDEIGDMSLKLQVKILRVLQDKRFEPIGSTKSHEVDVRIIAATNQDLELLVKNGRFREDLYYRLNVIPIRIPPLRERKSDIPLLIHHFLERIRTEEGRQVDGISDEAMKALIEYNWPGNVRELENLIERMSIMKMGGKIELSDLPDQIVKKCAAPLNVSAHMDGEVISLKDAVSEYEAGLIRQALEKSGGNKNKAAKLLCINRTTLIEKIKRLGIE
jgi:DNA-binding NtrC family response regulator